ncbi:MAG: asparagine synthase (glutamine-hydrolyzing), partial [Planctomycetes bacterium]|nr:asparagine synthase (glutamine-hydrolyzing) [Planctomycetota bacterium]
VKTLPKLIGMFAFAVWDTRARTLTLVRDRLGIKPLYFGFSEGTFLFGSELKALRRHPNFDATISRGALARFLQHNYIPAPYTIYEKFYKLPAGSTLTVSEADLSRTGPTCAVTWWDLRTSAASARENPFEGTFEEAVNELEMHLGEAVSSRMISDVPLGAFLSGGIDSSLVVALMQRAATKPVKTFSIGFEEAKYNEAEFARAVASHLGTDHTEYFVTPQEARDVIPKLPAMFDEPFSDSSQIPTFLVSQLARKHVTVSLSGDGGDELFGGYHRYFHLNSIWGRISRIPGRRLISRACRLAASATRAKWRERFRYRGQLLGMSDSAQLYQHGNLHWQPDCGIVPGVEPDHCPSTYWCRQEWLKTGNSVEEWMWLDTATYLPDDILVKVDRASMAVSLEARVPLLDHRVVDFAWRMPFAYKVDVGQREGKKPLRSLLSRYVPRKLFERPKMGFGVPIDGWMRGPLRDWAEDLLDERRLREDGYLNPDPIRHPWDLHMTGTADQHYPLWDVLMFVAWSRAETTGVSSA